MVSQDDVLKVMPDDGTPIKYGEIQDRLLEKGVIHKKPFGAVGQVIDKLCRWNLVERVRVGTYRKLTEK